MSMERGDWEALYQRVNAMNTGERMVAKRAYLAGQMAALNTAIQAFESLKVDVASGDAMPPTVGSN